MNKTPIYDWHVSKSDNIVPFGGYLLPVYYSSIVEEHLNVRTKAGLFDVSHMGEFIISGNNSEKFMQLVTINDVSKLSNGQAQYSAMCDDNGGIIDDVIIYKKKSEYMMVVNASNIEKNFNWLESVMIQDVILENKSMDIGLIAIQGPYSRRILQELIKQDISNLRFYDFIDGINIGGNEALLSRTGYTGELGFEIYANKNYLIKIWENLIEKGNKHGLIPAGLGCRDTLRLEMNYLLYGNDIDQKTNPIEAGLEWITKFNKGDFIGRESIIHKKDKISKHIFCFSMLDRAIPRKGCDVIFNDNVIGHVTSGTMSPILRKGIGMGYIEKSFYKVGSKVKINIRGKLKEAKIVNRPFYKHGSSRD
tara:strand:+ start:2498 stop:3589 length:1092 start_codon:yes stop_codon:yes gene_type:complete